jgi:hypothetical protein
MGLGYFVYDLWITVQHLSMFGVGMLFHAISALTVFSFGFVSAVLSIIPRSARLICEQRPFVNYYAPDFILYELSSPFLNIHWFCDKLELTGSTYQLVNGIFLISTFTICRLLWGSYASICVFRDIYTAYSHSSSWNTTAEIVPPQNVSTPLQGVSQGAEVMRYAGNREAPLWLCAAYLASNVVLNGLNWYWINKMIATIRKRFDPPFGTRKPEDKAKAEKEQLALETEDVDVARGVYADGHKSVEIAASQKVRRRPTVQRELTDLPGA